MTFKKKFNLNLNLFWSRIVGKYFILYFKRHTIYLSFQWSFRNGFRVYLSQPFFKLFLKMVSRLPYHLYQATICQCPTSTMCMGSNAQITCKGIYQNQRPYQQWGLHLCVLLSTHQRFIHMSHTIFTKCGFKGLHTTMYVGANVFNVSCP